MKPKTRVEDVLGRFWGDEVFALLNDTAKIFEKWAVELASEGDGRAGEMARVALAFRKWTEEGGLDEAVMELRRKVTE